MPGASFDLSGTVGLVVGGAGGIGQTLATGLAAAGADIVIADLPAQRGHAEEVAAAIRHTGRQVACLDLDITAVASIEAMMVEAMARSRACSGFIPHDYSTMRARRVLPLWLVLCSAIIATVAAIRLMDDSTLEQATGEK